MEQSSNPHSKPQFSTCLNPGLSTPKRSSPFQEECRGAWDEKGVGCHDMGPPLQMSACCLEGPAPTTSSFRACLPVTSSREPSLTPRHLAPHPVSWASTPAEPGHCGSRLWDQNLPAVASQSPVSAGSLLSVWVKDMQETVLESSASSSVGQ